MNPAYTSRETTHFVKDAQPKLFITSNLQGDAVFSELGAIVQDELTIAHEAREQDPLLEVEIVKNSDQATMLYTSGTTGKILVFGQRFF